MSKKNTKIQSQTNKASTLTEQIIHLAVMGFLYVVFLQIQLLYFANLVEFEKWIMIIVIVIFILISVKFTRIYWALVHHEK